MNKEYLLILPNVFIGESVTIGNITFDRYGSEDNRDPKNKNNDLLINVQQMLVNNGFSGFFTYHYFVSEDNFQKILLNIRKVITLFRFIAFEKYPELNLEYLTYYLFTPMKMEVDAPEMKYSLEGLQDGSIQTHLWAPGFKEVTRERNYPHILDFDKEHFLIKEFNSGQLKDKYIIAIERYNRTFKKDYDPVEDILNLTTAFEHIIELPRHDKAKSLANRLICELGLKGTSLEKYFINWSKQFYQVRNDISHGNVLKRYTERAGYNYWEECFKWKHPDGTVRYTRHAAIARQVFKLVIVERHSKVSRIDKNMLETAPQEVRKWLEETDRQIMESYVEPLITPNEVYYLRLKELVDSKKPFGPTDYEIIWRIKPHDGTEDKSVLLYLLNHFLRLAKNRFTYLGEKCDELEKLIGEGNISSASGKLIGLSYKIYQKSQEKKVITDEIVYNNMIARFFEKVHSPLVEIALREKLDKLS